MQGVVFIFVREDASDVEMLAEAFESAGYAISGADKTDNALNVIVWSRASVRSRSFYDAAEDALATGCAIVVSFIAPPARPDVMGAPIVDLSAWNGEEGEALNEMFERALDVLHPPRPNVIALPPRPNYEDAEFVEGPPQITSVTSESASSVRAVWDAPHQDPAPKRGAPSPRRDFRRLGARRSQTRAHAASAFAVIAILSAGAFVTSLAATATANVQNQRVEARSETSGVSLTSASADAIGLQDVAPEPAQEVGRRGIEPPSARSVQRVRYEP
jgi:hypothetical protein